MRRNRDRASRKTRGRFPHLQKERTLPSENHGLWRTPRSVFLQFPTRASQFVSVGLPGMDTDGLKVVIALDNPLSSPCRKY